MTLIARVFPRRTKATPTDDLAFVGMPPLQLPRADEVQISVTFTWHKRLAEHIASSWAQYFPVRLGGPAYDDRGDDFEPGRYLKKGYTFTSRGCPNQCPFCLAWRREGPLRLLPITPGHIVLDNNLLACPRPHIEAVLDMLSRQNHKAEFAGGLEAARVDPWFVKAITDIRFTRAYLAYDRPSQRKPVAEALRLFREANIRHDQLSCYVLVGFDGDTIEAATERCQFVQHNGAVPYPMYFRDESAQYRPNDVAWEDFVGKRLHRPGIHQPATDEPSLF